MMRSTSPTIFLVSPDKRLPPLATQVAGKGNDKDRMFEERPDQISSSSLPLPSCPTPPHSSASSKRPNSFKTAGNAQSPISPRSFTSEHHSDTSTSALTATATNTLQNQPSYPSTIHSPSRPTTTTTTDTQSGPMDSLNKPQSYPSEWGWRTPSDSSVSFPTGSVSSSSQRKRGTAARPLLAGIGKGLNRVGSVMRRPSPGTGNDDGQGGSAGLGRTKTLLKRWKAPAAVEEACEGSSAVDQGDTGIGRPYNVVVSQREYHEDFLSLSPLYSSTTRMDRAT
ncbi:hypothetical protein BCR39DRAFT_291012 [Naematelia encephala]|uniref:Uncharacterized protein n=1 Tax=Naematelia encephala TaxID=71784 RepID=A0A1Y2AS34_9TREE|nr:hypothetical protein BCR39DRAFT_291012 [Naematelia encephala]